MKKHCPRCQTTKPLDPENWNRNRRRSDGFDFYCRPCQSKRFKSYERKYRGKNAKAEVAGDKTFTRELKSKRFLITSAQNNTTIHERFFAALKIAAKELKAEILVVPYRYKNPTGLKPGTDLRECGKPFVVTKRSVPEEVKCRRRIHHEDECSLEPDPVDELWWDPQVEPYLVNVRTELNSNIVLAADVKIQPTATRPLSGFESLTGSESCIIGHPKMQFRSIPAPSGRYPKILTTTGACTERNYSNTKAGALGEFHHCLGALIVEVEGKSFHLRQLNANRGTGEFTDLDRVFSATGVSKAPPALGLVMGDTHARFTDPVVDKATFGRGGMVETLNPKTLVFHDIFDGYSVNPHHRGNPFISRAKVLGQVGNVKAEVNHAIEFVETRAKGREAVIVKSNHDDFLHRWVLSHDWKTDPVNAGFYLETAKVMWDSVKLTPQGTEYTDPFPFWVRRLAPKNVRCLEKDESFKLGDVECGLHGDNGPNGARGTLNNLSRLGSRTVSGHSHTPGIEEGAYSVGTSSPLRLEYMFGPSSWLNTHCVIYASGKRALITIVDGKWRGVL